MNISNIIIRLLSRFPVYGQVISNVAFVETKCIETAATDGFRIYYNPDFISKLTQDEQVFIFSHEIMHIAHDHIKRGIGKKHKRWNYSTDATINAYLKYECGLPLPEGGIDCPDALDKSSEEIYDSLPKQKENEKYKKNHGPGGGGHGTDSEQSGDDQNDDFDDDFDYDENSFGDHELWDEAVKKAFRDAMENASEEEKEKQRKKEEKLRDALSKLPKDEKDAMDKNKDMMEENKKKTLEREASRKRGAGASTSGVKLKRNSLGVTKEVPWQRILDDIVSGSGYYDYSNPKQVKYGIISDSWRVLPSIEVEIVIDVSGSVSGDLVRNFLMECKGIFDEYESRLEMKIGFFDTEFRAPTIGGTYENKIGPNTKVISSPHEIDELEIISGGGTDFKVALSGFSERATNKIIFTDGLDEWKNLPKKDVIWIVYGENPPVINPPGAKAVIYIKGEQFDKLNKTHFNLGRSR